MIRPFFAAAALVALSGIGAHAFDVSAMTDAERQAFREEVRDYLLENPEVLMEAIGILEARQEEEQRRNDLDLVAQNLEALTEDAFSWIGGNPDGDITIVEFLDYRCGYCRRSHPEVAELLETDGNIRLIVKEFPILGEASVLSSRFAIATRMVEGDAAYKAVHDALIAMRSNVTLPALETLASNLDLDAEAILAEMESPDIDRILGANRELAERLRITGTPTFVVGNEMLRGYLPLDGMREVVKEQRG